MHPLRLRAKGILHKHYGLVNEVDLPELRVNDFEIIIPVYWNLTI